MVERWITKKRGSAGLLTSSGWLLNYQTSSSMIKPAIHGHEELPFVEDRNGKRTGRVNYAPRKGDWTLFRQSR